MKFDEWTTEAHRSLEAWNPEPVVRPVAPMARSEAGDVSAADPDATPVYVELSPVRGRRPAATRRRLLAAVAAAAAVFAAAGLAATTISSADTDVAIGPGAEPTQPAAELPDPGPSSGPWFDCSAADVESGASTEVFDDSTDVAEWRAIDVDDPEAQPSTSGSVNDVKGTLVASEGEDLAGTAARGATFVAALAPGWTCTVWSPEVDVADSSRPGPIVEDNVVTNRLGGMCFVPDATTTPGSVWGIDPSLAAALDQVDGLTGWRVILADGGGNDQGPGRLWMEFAFEADPSAGDSGATTGVLAGVSTAVDAAGAAAGVPTECAVH